MRRTVVAAAAAAALVAGAAALVFYGSGGADADNAQQVARGRQVYAAQCASCHGANLEGQPDWRRRLPNGRLPAPPHDASGHTWHHPDRVLFEITRDGIAAYAPPSYESDMLGFGQTLTEAEIWAALAYIKSTWPAEVRERQRQMSAR